MILGQMIIFLILLFFVLFIISIYLRIKLWVVLRRDHDGGRMAREWTWIWFSSFTKADRLILGLLLCAKNGNHNSELEEYVQLQNAHNKIHIHICIDILHLLASFSWVLDGFLKLQVMSSWIFLIHFLFDRILIIYLIFNSHWF